MSSSLPLHLELLISSPNFPSPVLDDRLQTLCLQLANTHRTVLAASIEDDEQIMLQALFDELQHQLLTLGVFVQQSHSVKFYHHHENLSSTFRTVKFLWKEYLTLANVVLKNAQQNPVRIARRTSCSSPGSRRSSTSTTSLNGKEQLKSLH